MKKWALWAGAAALGIGVAAAERILATAAEQGWTKPAGSARAAR